MQKYYLRSRTRPDKPPAKFRISLGLRTAADLPAQWHRRVIAYGPCWVVVDALDRSIGFLSAEVFSNELHIWELSLLHERQRAGIGRPLVQRSIDHAKSRYLSSITLTTFRNVPWNELFYTATRFHNVAGRRSRSAPQSFCKRSIERGWPSPCEVSRRIALHAPTATRRQVALSIRPRDMSYHYRGRGYARASIECLCCRGVQSKSSSHLGSEL